MGERCAGSGSAKGGQDLASRPARERRRIPYERRPFGEPRNEKFQVRKPAKQQADVTRPSGVSEDSRKH